jgi:hypothetical protein
MRVKMLSFKVPSYAIYKLLVFDVPDGCGASAWVCRLLSPIRKVRQHLPQAPFWVTLTHFFKGYKKLSSSRAHGNLSFTLGNLLMSLFG